MNNPLKSLQSILKNSMLLALIISLSSFATAQDTSQKNTFKFKTVVIDAGHGGKDPGTHGLKTNEKTIALSIAKKLRTALQEQMPGITTVMTRSDDTFIPLDRRAGIANERNGNLFISIHCNSSPEGTRYSAHKQKGTMILVYGYNRVNKQVEAIRENSAITFEKDYKTKYGNLNADDPVNQILINAYLQKYRKQSIMFGDLLNQEFKSGGRQTIGVKEQVILVLDHSAMPAVMIETGFINNPTDEDYLMSDAGQDEIVQVTVNALKQYKDKITVK
jgi:N-acetylmuramoyl-L-alanine amidase